MQITKENEPGLQKSFGTWYPLMRRFIETDQFSQIFATLRSEKQKGKNIYPIASEVFKSFELCSRHKIKALVILQCPYATVRQGTVIANGIPMDCSNIKPYQQPSLHNWYMGLETTYGFHPDNDLRCSLEYLLKEESVMLINSSLTVEESKPDTHMQLWEPFMRYFIEEVINKYNCGMPVVLIGSTAQRLENSFNPMCHHILKCEHMAAAAHQNREWKFNNMFEWCNQIIRANNGPREEIQWLRKKSEPVRKHVVADAGPDMSDVPF